MTLYVLKHCETGLRVR